MRGMTKKPCHGCGAPGYHPLNEVCGNCTRLLQEAQTARERQAQDTKYGLYLHSSVPHWNPGYYGSGAHGDSGVAEARSTIQKAFTALVMAVAETAVGRPILTGDDKTPCLLTRRSQAHYDSPSGMDFIKMPVAVRNALDVLDEAIRTFEKAGYAAGKRTGEDLLGRLAAGEVGLTEFDDRRER